MKIEDVAIGAQVRPVGYPALGQGVFVQERPDAPVMVVREVLVSVSWFVNGFEHRSAFHADELEAVAK